MSHKRASGQHKIRSCSKKSFIDKEIFLLPSKIRADMFYSRIKKLSYFCASTVYCIERTQQGSLVVKRLSRIRDEYCWNTKCLIDNKCRRRDVPS